MHKSTSRPESSIHLYGYQYLLQVVIRSLPSMSTSVSVVPTPPCEVPRYEDNHLKRYCTANPVIRPQGPSLVDVRCGGGAVVAVARIDSPSHLLTFACRRGLVAEGAEKHRTTYVDLEIMSSLATNNRETRCFCTHSNIRYCFVEGKRIV